MCIRDRKRSIPGMHKADAVTGEPPKVRRTISGLIWKAAYPVYACSWRSPDIVLSLIHILCETDITAFHTVDLIQDILVSVSYTHLSATPLPVSGKTIRFISACSGVPI